MQSKESADKKSILNIIRRINELWQDKRYDDIARYLSEHVVVAPPGLEGRIRGREAYVQSYRDYDQSARTLEFQADEPEIDIIGDTAIALCPFLVLYEMNSQTYQERGRDLLVFTLSSGNWQIIWRTMQTGMDV